MGALVCSTGRFTMRRFANRKRYALIQRFKSSTAEGLRPEARKMISEEVKVIHPSKMESPPPLWQRLGPVSKGFNAYGRAHNRRPYMTQICSSLAIYFCGDLLAQNLEGEDYKYNVWRTGRNMVIGGICATPSYMWYVPTVDDVDQ